MSIRATRRTTTHRIHYRLRRKISIPYQSLNTSLSRLQKFQQASDVLRRTSRFVVLARRLEGQMTEMDGVSSAELSYQTSGANSSTTPKASDSSATLGASILGDSGDEKERTIAKAALSIAELGKSPRS